MNILKAAIRGFPRGSAKLRWKACPACPEGRAEAIGIRAGDRLFLIGGYGSLDRVLNVIDAFHLQKQRWTGRIDMPPQVPQTHSGAACGEERFIYLVGGQLGPRCSPAIADCFVFDSQTHSWETLPPLPEPRYSPAVQIIEGRLHAISGAKPDRWTSALDHWSLAVAGGRALEDRWREETPVPKGGPHRASAIANGRLYLLGGQDGDMKPVTADPRHTCDIDTPLETLYGDSFQWEPVTRQWKRLTPMPAARTHSEQGITIGQYIALVGGNEGRHRLSDLIQVYDTLADRWRSAGHLPFSMKTASVYHRGWLYVISGQRSKSVNNLRPGTIVNTVWRARFDPARGWA